MPNNLFALARTVVRTGRGIGHSLRPYRRSRCWRECREGYLVREPDERSSISGGAQRANMLRKIGVEQNTSARVGAERSRSLMAYRKKTCDLRHSLFAPVVRIRFFCLAKLKVQPSRSVTGSKSVTFGPL